MTLNLTTGAPTDDATGLTAGKSYAIHHRGGITAAVAVDGAYQEIYNGRHGGSTVLIGIPGTVIRCALAAGETEADIEITELA